MWTGIKIVPDNTKIDFIGQRYWTLVISLILIFGTIFLLATRELNYGIDFTGGTLMEIGLPVEAPDIGALRSMLNNLELGEISIQEFGQPSHLLLRVPAQGEDPEVQAAAIQQVRDALEDKYTGVDYRRVEFVGPQVGKELKMKGFYAVLFSMLGIMGYIAYRFEWQFGVAALVALFHDVIGAVGFLALTGKTFDLATVAAVLMVAGFSINDTVVIFDRIREIMRKYRKKPLAEVCNIALNETLSRTIMTSVTTLIALGALWVYGGEVLRVFVDVLFIGFIVGTYSSIYVATALLLYMRVRMNPPETASPDQKEGTVS